MRIADCSLKSVSPYSQNRYYDKEMVPVQAGETVGAYETRTWRNRCHSDDKSGQIFIPVMAFTNSIKEAAQYLSLPIPGKARQTYTKHFDAGVLANGHVYLPILKDEVPGEWVLVPSDGKRNTTSGRVMKCFPVIPEWEGTVTFWIMDDKISQEAFSKTLETAGMLIGIGRFRVRNRGVYGRFIAQEIKWTTK